MRSSISLCDVGVASMGTVCVWGGGGGGEEGERGRERGERGGREGEGRGRGRGKRGREERGEGLYLATKLTQFSHPSH